MKEAIGKHMAALRIGCELNFIDSNEIDRARYGHGFYGANEIARIGRDNFFFPRD